jgi:hypothetical protein
MKRFKVVALGAALTLACWASAPRPAAADECCDSMQQEVEDICARMGSSVRYFYCVPGWEGSLCGASYDCYPPAQ